MSLKCYKYLRLARFLRLKWNPLQVRSKLCYASRNNRVLYLRQTFFDAFTFCASKTFINRSSCNQAKQFFISFANFKH